METRPVTQPADLDAVRASYDRVADSYVQLMQTTGMADFRTQPWLRAAIDIFADAVGDLGPVLDVGCGPGQVTAYLAERGLDVSGVDLSPRMVDHARQLYPECRFEVASATELELAPFSLGGILGWWSLFNLPRDVLPSVIGGFHAALRPAGQLIIATHVGEEDVIRTEAYGGIPVQWTTHRWRPEQLRQLLEQAGFAVTAELRLQPTDAPGPGVVLLAERPAA